MWVRADRVKMICGGRSAWGLFFLRSVSPNWGSVVDVWKRGKKNRFSGMARVTSEQLQSHDHENSGQPASRFISQHFRYFCESKRRIQ